MNVETLAPQPSSPSDQPISQARINLSVATDADREALYRLRHEVYARELRQHLVNSAGCLRDALDESNIYLIAKVDGQIAGFISITPPGPHGYSIDKYVARQSLPFACDRRLHEIRLLTVLRPHRGRELATLLMYAAFRWIEARGGTRVIAIGRRQVVDMYLRGGLEPVGVAIQSGAVTYDLLQAPIVAIRQRMKQFGGLLERLERSRDIINADVLDAWFPPSPKVTATLREYLPWLLRTSPPTGCEGLINTIAQARDVAPENVLPGAGSSDLIFRALRHWLTPASHALVLDPTYGEYAHVLEQVIGCALDRLTLSHRNHYAVDLGLLEAALADDYDLVVLVNPNSPTGRHVPRAEMERVLSRAPARTRVWVDETYVDYAGTGQSLEPFAANSENVIVSKSMSKVYALSCARAAYLCAGPHQLEELRAITPPWVISLPAQVAAVRALQDPGYYAARYAETAELREELAGELRNMGLDIIPGIANFILAHLP